MLCAHQCYRATKPSGTARDPEQAHPSPNIFLGFAAFASRVVEEAAGDHQTWPRRPRTQQGRKRNRPRTLPRRRRPPDAGGVQDPRHGGELDLF